MATSHTTKSASRHNSPENGYPLKFRPDAQNPCPMTARKNGYGPEHNGQTTKTKPGTLSGSKPYPRIETGSHVLFMTLVSITIGAVQDRHNSPADPPHTKAHSIIFFSSQMPDVITLAV
jgi:hypothetical protein